MQDKSLKLAQQGKIKEAFEIQNVTNDLIEGILGNGLYQTIKGLLELEGVQAGYCREPMTKEQTPAQKEVTKQLKAKFL